VDDDDDDVVVRILVSDELELVEEGNAVAVTVTADNGRFFPTCKGT
jgi:hypothetical protein